MFKYFFNTLGVGLGIISTLFIYDKCVDKYFDYLENKGE